MSHVISFIYALSIYIGIHAGCFLLTMPFINWLDRMDHTPEHEQWEQLELPVQEYDQPKMFQE